MIATDTYDRVEWGYLSAYLTMASYGVFISICGFDYHGPKGRLGFAPWLQPEDFRAPFVAAQGWGTFTQKRLPNRQTENIELRHGILRLNSLSFELQDTVAKKIATLKRKFNLAVERHQLEDNPFHHLKKPKAPDGEIHVYSDEECDRLVKAARDIKIGKLYRWDMIFLTDLCTGMRRGELLNTTWLSGRT